LVATISAVPTLINWGNSNNASPDSFANTALRSSPSMLNATYASGSVVTSNCDVPIGIEEK